MQKLRNITVTVRPDQYRGARYLTHYGNRPSYIQSLGSVKTHDIVFETPAVKL